MKKLLSIILILALLLPCAAVAETIAVADGATITVTGSASVTLKADYAQVSVGVSTTAETVQKASEENNDAIFTVIAAISS